MNQGRLTDEEKKFIDGQRSGIKLLPVVCVLHFIFVLVVIYFVVVRDNVNAMRVVLPVLLFQSLERLWFSQFSVEKWIDIVDRLAGKDGGG